MIKPAGVRDGDYFGPVHQFFQRTIKRWTYTFALVPLNRMGYREALANNKDTMVWVVLNARWRNGQLKPYDAPPAFIPVPASKVRAWARRGWQHPPVPRMWQGAERASTQMAAACRASRDGLRRHPGTWYTVDLPLYDVLHTDKALDNILDYALSVPPACAACHPRFGPTSAHWQQWLNVYEPHTFFVCNLCRKFFYFPNQNINHAAWIRHRSTFDMAYDIYQSDGAEHARPELPHARGCACWHCRIAALNFPAWICTIKHGAHGITQSACFGLRILLEYMSGIELAACNRFVRSVERIALFWTIDLGPLFHSDLCCWGTQMIRIPCRLCGVEEFPAFLAHHHLLFICQDCYDKVKSDADDCHLSVLSLIGGCYDPFEFPLGERITCTKCSCGRTTLTYTSLHLPRLRLCATCNVGVSQFQIISAHRPPRTIASFVIRVHEL